MSRAAENFQSQLAVERSSQAALMAAKRAAGRDLEIPACRNPRRRRKASRDPAYFLRTYFERIYYNPFSKNQRRIISEFNECIQYRYCKSLAAPRGDGKSAISQGLSIEALFNAKLHYMALLRANATSSAESLESMKKEIFDNELLAEDYPEICVPIRALEGSPVRGNLQTVGGQHTHIKWASNFMVLPRVDGSPASGAILKCHGVESPVRGLLYRGRRPELILIDDIEDEESAKSDAGILFREDMLEKAIPGLAGQGSGIAILLLCTIINEKCIAATFTDPQLKPAWAGERLSLIERWPDAEEMWKRYVELRRRAQIAGDRFAMDANKYYFDHRGQMDEGAVVTNPYRFEKTLLPDGTPKEVSTIQFAYNYISDYGREAFDTEYQNVPPQNDGEPQVELTAPTVQQRLSGIPRGFVPGKAETIVAAVDVGARKLDWGIWAFSEGRGYLIDVGMTDVHSPQYANLQDKAHAKAIENAIYSALLELDADFSGGWINIETGEEMQLDRCFIDSGYMSKAVYRFCRDKNGGPYAPSKGAGNSRGMRGYNPPNRKVRGKRLGEHNFSTYIARYKLWLYTLDTDNLKLLVHSGLGCSINEPGALLLFGDDPLVHHGMVRQLLAEKYIVENPTGRGTVSYWKTFGSRQNHQFDVTYMALAAALAEGFSTDADPNADTDESEPADAQGKTADNENQHSPSESPVNKPVVETSKAVVAAGFKPITNPANVAVIDRKTVIANCRHYGLRVDVPENQARKLLITRLRSMASDQSDQDKLATSKKHKRRSAVKDTKPPRPRRKGRIQMFR